MSRVLIICKLTVNSRCADILL